MGKYLCDPVQIFSLSEKNISNDIEIVSIATGRKHINCVSVFIYALYDPAVECFVMEPRINMAGASCIRL